MKVLDMGRDQLLAVGLNVAQDFCNRNAIRLPEFRAVRRGPDRGWYRPERVTINVPACRPPTKTPGFAWSFPGYKADMTVFGVIAHEYGHHVDHVVNDGYGIVGTWQHESVSGYEPNRNEAFAETVRLLITNPNLLEVGRPMRWTYLTSTLKLDPGPYVGWKETLEERGAHPRFIFAAMNWIKRGHS